MGCDIVVALGPAAVNSQTLLGLNCHRPPRECQVLLLARGRAFAPGEVVNHPLLELPQVRQTFTALAGQSHGAWGYHYGVNERRLAAACSTWRSRLSRVAPGLTGPDLVRLALERCGSARQALDLLCDLLARYGECGDHVFLLADPHEAYTLEAAGGRWAAQEIHQVRAAGDLAVIRQDWCRLSPGLAAEAIERGWWPEDGSKLDFAGSLAEEPTGSASALRRWGRATRLLEEQNGHIDAAYLRRLLADHYEGTRYEVDPLAHSARVSPLCQHGNAADGLATAASFVVCLPADEEQLPVAWCGFGPPCLGVHFPLFLDGELPAPFSSGGSLYQADSLWWRLRHLADTARTDARRWEQVRRVMADLQGRFDQEADDFLTEAAGLWRQGARAELSRLAGSLMQSHMERFDEVLWGLQPPGPRLANLAEASWS